MRFPMCVFNLFGGTSTVLTRICMFSSVFSNVWLLFPEIKKNQGFSCILHATEHYWALLRTTDFWNFFGGFHAFSHVFFNLFGGTSTVLTRIVCFPRVGRIGLILKIRDIETCQILLRLSKAQSCPEWPREWNWVNKLALVSTTSARSHFGCFLVFSP